MAASIHGIKGAKLHSLQHLLLYLHGPAVLPLRLLRASTARRMLWLAILPLCIPKPLSAVYSYKEVAD